MNKLVIITGISGTGKTTLATTLYDKIENSTLLSSDKLSESIYDIVGFKNINQKKSLQTIKHELYKKLIEECMRRKDEIIILEKPFKIEWKVFLKNVSRQYKYEVYTINMFAKNFDTIWNRLLKRENSKQDRHPSHYLNTYYLKNKNNYIPYFEYEYDILKKEYDDLLSNSINLGTIINIDDIEELNIDNLIKRLLS